MKIGFAHIPSFEFPRSVELIRDAERWGCDTAWLPDQPFYLDPYPILTAASQQTSRIVLGVGVTNPFTSHPVITARLAATVAEAAEGRFILGLGTGNRREFLRPLGVEGKGPGVEWCREAIKVIRSLWRGETTHQPDFFVADDARLSFQARDDLPIYVAGIGRGILEMAGQHADGAIINFASPRGLNAALIPFNRGRSIGANDRGPAEIVAWATGIIVDGDRSAAYDRLRPFIAHTIAPTAVANLESLGMPEPVITAIKDDYRAHGPEVAARHVTDQMIDDWSWVGPSGAIGERVLELKESGVTEAAMVPFTRDLDEMRSIVKAFATVVGPLVQ